MGENTCLYRKKCFQQYHTFSIHTQTSKHNAKQFIEKSNTSYANLIVTEESSELCTFTAGEMFKNFSLINELLLTCQQHDAELY